MKIHDCKQNTTEWLDLRAGIPTASQFDRIITPTGKPSASAIPYMHQLLAERLMGRPIIGYVSIDIDRGKNLEADAVSFYEFTRDVTTVAVGFVTNDEETIGASPDRFVGDDGLLETKVPKEHTHVGYLLGNPVDRAYFPQLMGQLWITGRAYAEILSYHPSMPPALVRVERDEKYIALLANAVTAFSMELESQWEKLRAEYVKPEPPKEDPWLTDEDVAFAIARVEG